MIPRIIHYCWFGRNPLPKSAQKCIESWKKYFPDYEIREWNEDNFDVNIIPYTQEAYAVKKYAFVSDFARFWILYKYGGLYFDTDVEVLKSMDAIITRGPFMGCEYEAGDMSVASVAPGLGLGANPGLGLYKEILDLYTSIHFVNKNGSFNQKTVVQYMTELLCKYGMLQINKAQFIEGIWIYPQEYFCPFHGRSIRFTKNTYSVHHYMSSWSKLTIRKKIVRCIHFIMLRCYKFIYRL